MSTDLPQADAALIVATHLAREPVRLVPRASLAAVIALALLLGACGAGEDAAGEQRIARERAEAATIARQEERIKQLEREQRPAREGSRTPGEPSVTIVQPAPAGRPAVVQPSPPAPPRASDDWPGGAGYTTILASLGSQDAARRVQSQATERGLDAGVLFSTTYRSLRSGYWVVFSGASSSKRDADQRTARAKSLGYGDAYPRFVSR